MASRQETTVREKKDARGEIISVAIEALARASRGLASYHMNACVKCGLCGETCHIYQAEPEPKNLPAAKAAEVASFYRRYHTFLGKHAPLLCGARDLTEERLDKLVESVYGRCTACGRCGLHCSIGLDLASILRVGRNILAATGKVPEGLERTVQNQITTGNQMAIPPEELHSTAEWLAEDLKLEMDDEGASVPVDQTGRRVLYLINPREVKFFPLSLMAAAGVFRAAGESWTLSSRFYDVTNYGLFSGDDKSAAVLTKRVLEEAHRLGVEEVVLSECGHGFRSFRWEGPNWLQSAYRLPMRSILELLEEYLDEGRIQVDPGKNAERVTLHDPCNLVRWGGVSEPQRRVLRRVVQEFVEMTPNRAHNFCCGGGGGMLSMSEYGERRVASGATKAEQIRATGAKIVATPCHNCADQLIELSKRYKLGVEIQAVVELVYSALA
ncbi:(Fe-S)-binding protein [Candidatus Eisenbacteria bacterium]|uniref:(Fe-S)-binding protein n=1 Tax=Eiseniibacteriota bacterium TaxID=2212470 RepID=A0ABV6YID7_UNCEI